MEKIRWIIFSAVVVLVLGGLIAFSSANRTKIDVASVDVATFTAASKQNGNIGDHILNDNKTDIILVEYGDFQCPGCAAAHPNVKDLLAEYSNKISFVFRHFPLTSIHPNARAAAAAAEAAGLQGKFFAMHDLLYENQTDWQNADAAQRTTLFTSYAESLGLDLEKFKNDLSSADINQKISFDQEIGKRLGVNSTPTFYLNGEKLADEASQGLLQGDLTAVKAELDKLLKS